MKRFFIYFFLSNLLYAAAIFTDVLGGETPVGDWVRVPYLLSYSHGFVKRGFPGTLLDLLNLQATPLTVAIAYTVALETFAVLFYLLVVRNAKDSSLLPYMLILFVLSPATFFHMGDDVGRTDIYLLLLLVLSFMKPRISPLFTSLAMLIHEGYVLLGLPAVVGYLTLRGRKQLATLNGVIGILLTVLVSVSGRLNREGLEFYADVFKNMGLGTTDPLRPLIFSPLENTVFFYRKFFLNPDTFPLVIIGFVSALLLFSLYYFLFLRTVRGPLPYKLFPLFPLLMFLFGIDYFRWVAFGTVVMAIWWSVMVGEFGTANPRRAEKFVFLLSLMSLPAEMLKEILI